MTLTEREMVSDLCVSIKDFMELVTENTIKVRCKDCPNWNWNKFPNAEPMGIPCGCTIFRGLGRSPREYCSKGEEYADNVTG